MFYYKNVYKILNFENIYTYNEIYLNKICFIILFKFKYKRTYNFIK